MNKDKLISILKNSLAIVVMLAMFIIIFYQNRDRDIFKFGRDESSSVITPNQDGMSGYANADIKRMGDKVVYMNTTSYNIFNEKAEGDNVDLALSNPGLHIEDEFAVCYNKDSFEASVFKKETQHYSVKTSGKIIRAKVNKNGYLFVATEKEGYNCECMVYNRNGEAIFKWDISKSEFLDGDVNCSNNMIVLSVASAQKDNLFGEIVLIDITQAKVIKKDSYDKKVFFSVDFNRNDTFTALGSHCLTYYNSDGTKKWNYSFKDKTLINADVSNPDMMVLAFKKVKGGISGDSTDVKIINRLGGKIAEKNFMGIAEDIAISESHVALAFGKKIYVCDSKLKEKKAIEYEATVKKIALFNDNKHVFVIGSSGAKILK